MSLRGAFHLPLPDAKAHSCDQDARRTGSGEPGNAFGGAAGLRAQARAEIKVAGISRLPEVSYEKDQGQTHEPDVKCGTNRNDGKKPSGNAGKKTKSFPWKWILAGLVIIGLIIASRILPVAQWLAALNLWLDELGAMGIVVFIFAYILATILFLPGAILTIGAGFVFGLLWGFVGVSLGSTTGAACAFLIGRYFARDKVQKMASEKPRFNAIDRAVGKQGWKIVLLLRLSPLVPFNLQNYVYGLTAIRFWPYVAASWVGMIPGTLLYVYLGAAGRAGVEAAARGELERDPLEIAFFAVGLIATIVVTVYVTRIARRALKEAEPEVEEAS